VPDHQVVQFLLDGRKVAGLDFDQLPIAHHIHQVPIDQHLGLGRRLSVMGFERGVQGLFVQLSDVMHVKGDYTAHQGWPHWIAVTIIGLKDFLNHEEHNTILAQ